MHIEMIRVIYTNSSVTLRQHKERGGIKFKGGVRQGDTISHTQFTATLESKFRRLSWENKGVKIKTDNVFIFSTISALLMTYPYA